MKGRKVKFSRDEIVATAFKMVQKNGWKGLSVPALAKKINSSTMPIYSHFKNIDELKDVVYLKALDFLMDYTTTERTGDKWIDHAVGYARFAAEEAHLHRCLFDWRNPGLQKRSLKKWSELLGGELADYPLFEGLSDKQISLIRYSRFLLVHGYASGINNVWDEQLEDKDLERFIAVTSKALCEDLKAEFEADMQAEQASADEP